MESEVLIWYKGIRHSINLPKNVNIDWDKMYESTSNFKTIHINDSESLTCYVPDEYLEDYNMNVDKTIFVINLQGSRYGYPQGTLLPVTLDNTYNGYCFNFKDYNLCSDCVTYIIDKEEWEIGRVEQECVLDGIPHVIRNVTRIVKYDS